MKLKVNPTRQELLKIKKRLKTAQSGHDLLKEKLDGLMQEFLGNIRELQKLREGLGEKISPAFYHFFLSASRAGQEETENLISHLPLADVNLTFRNIMGVQIREGNVVNREKLEESKISLHSVDSDLYRSKEDISAIRNNLINYENLTIKIRLLAEEIEKTRRRVNSLEHVYIPEMMRVRKYISQKLEERERFDRTVILKLKEIMS